MVARESLTSYNLRENEYKVAVPQPRTKKYIDLLRPNVLLVGNDLSTGFSEEVIKQILAVCAEVPYLTLPYLMLKREARQEEAIKHPRPFFLCLRVFCEDESKEFDAMKVSGENTELCR